MAYANGYGHVKYSIRIAEARPKLTCEYALVFLLQFYT